MIWAIREAYQEAARVQDWHRQGQGIDNQTGWRHSTTGLGIDCLFVGTECLCGLDSRSEPHTGGADHRRDRPTAPQPPTMAGVEMRYLTNAARHRQTIQRMLDNGVEVVVAVRKDGVPPWCRRICLLHACRQSCSPRKVAWGDRHVRRSSRDHERERRRPRAHGPSLLSVETSSSVRAET